MLSEDSLETLLVICYVLKFTQRVCFRPFELKREECLLSMQRRRDCKMSTSAQKTSYIKLTKAVWQRTGDKPVDKSTVSSTQGDQMHSYSHCQHQHLDYARECE